MPRFTGNEINDQKVRISKSLYVIAPWLNDYTLWLNKEGIFKGHHYNPICSNYRRRPMSTDEFKKNLLIMIGIICDCGEQLQDLDDQDDDIVLSFCLHNPFGLSSLFFKMLDIDLGLRTEEITHSDYMNALSKQQALLSESAFPYVDVYNSIKDIFIDSSVVENLCSLHEDAVNNMNTFSSDDKTGGYNAGKLKMCLVYNLVRRVLLTMQVSRYTERELALLKIDVSKCSEDLLSTEANRDEVNFMFESDIKKISDCNEATFLTGIVILRECRPCRQ